MAQKRLSEYDPRRGRSGRPLERLKKTVYAMVFCHICGKPVRYDVGPRHPLAPSLDHLVPLSMGGHPLDPANAALAHFGCNARRGNRPLLDPPRPSTRDYS